MSDAIAVALGQLEDELSAALTTIDSLSDAERQVEWPRLIGADRPDPFSLIRALSPARDVGPAAAAWIALAESLARTVAGATTPWSLTVTAGGRQLQVRSGGTASLEAAPGSAPGFALRIGAPAAHLSFGPLALSAGPLSLTGALALPASLAIELSPLPPPDDVALAIELKGVEYLSPFLDGGSIRAGGSVRATLDGVSGFRFGGGDRQGLELPVLASPGFAQDIRFSLAAFPEAEGAFGLELSFGAELGPFRFAVDRLALPFAPGELKLRPPSGIAIRTSTPPIRGGGFLLLDIDRGRFGGALELQLGALAVRAVAILTIDPFSLLILLRVEFVPAIELGLGFTLNAVGGMIALDRAIDRDAFVQASFDGSLARALFPADPVGDAPEIIRSLSRVFPLAPGRVIAGPALRLGWGRPHPWVTADLTLVLQIPDPMVAIAGQFRMAVPHQDAPLVDLRADGFGLIDPAKGIDLGGVLRGSRMGAFAVEGGMGLRIHPGEREGFILSVGGFHPRYVPPPGFAGPPRVSIQISDTPLLRVRFGGYVALTSGTLQIGAALDLQVGIDEFGAQGRLAFDGFITWQPHFAFIAELTGSVAITVFGGESLMSASLNLLLEGPEPCWHARGHASVSTFLFDVDIAFDEHWACSPPRPVEAPDVATLLAAQAARPENWFAQPPSGQRAVIVRGLRDEAAMLMHPEGALRFSQRLVPLDTAVSRFGGARLAAPTVFGVDVNVAGAGNLPRFETFARAEFVELTSDERLSGAAFEPFKSGVEIDPGAVGHGEAIDVGQRYETIVFDSPDGESSRLHDGRRRHLDWLSDLPLEAGAVAGSAVHAARRFSVAAATGGAAPPQITTAASRFEARSIRDLAAAAVPGLDAARTLDEAKSILHTQARQNPAAFGGLRLVDRNPTGQA
jgi:hypothetical protein